MSFAFCEGGGCAKCGQYIGALIFATSLTVTNRNLKKASQMRQCTLARDSQHNPIGEFFHSVFAPCLASASVRIAILSGRCTDTTSSRNIVVEFSYFGSPGPSGPFGLPGLWPPALLPSAPPLPNLKKSKNMRK